MLAEALDRAGLHAGGCSSLSVLFNVQLLCKAFPRLFKTDADVEVMRIFAPRGGRQEEQFAPAKSCLVLHRLNQCTADSTALIAVVDHERADLRCRPITLERRRDLQVREPYRMSLEVGDDDAVAEDPEPLEAALDGGRLRRIAELTEQEGDGRRIRRLCVPDRQTHGTRL